MKGKSTRTQNVNQRNLVWVVRSVLAAGLWISTADAAGRDAVFLKEMAVNYPKQCKPSMAGKTGTTGLCLRVSTGPKVSGDFRVRSARRGISDRQTADGVPVPVNTVLALPPGDYEIFKATGIDSQNKATVTLT